MAVLRTPGELLSMTLTMASNDPELAGKPVIRPMEGLMDSPLGSPAAL